MPAGHAGPRGVGRAGPRGVGRGPRLRTNRAGRPAWRATPRGRGPMRGLGLANRSTFTCMLAWLGGVGGQQSGCRSDQFTAAHSLAALCQRRRPRGGRRPRSPATPPGRPSCPSPSACAERGGVGPGRGLRGRRPHSLLHRLPGRTTQLLEQTRARRPGRGGPTSAQCPAQTGRAGPGWRRPSKTRRPTRGQTRSGKGEERRGIRRCDGVEGGKRAPRRGGRARNGGGRPVWRWQPTPALPSPKHTHTPLQTCRRASLPASSACRAAVTSAASKSGMSLPTITAARAPRASEAESAAVRRAPRSGASACGSKRSGV